MGSKGVKVMVLDDTGMKVRQAKDSEKFKDLDMSPFCIRDHEWRIGCPLLRRIVHVLLKGAPSKPGPSPQVMLLK